MTTITQTQSAPLPYATAPSATKPEANGLRRALRWLAYPSLLLANAGLMVWAAANELPFAAVAMPGLLASLVALFVLERIQPHRRTWHPNRKEALRDLFYFGMNGGLDALAKMGTAFAVATLGSWHNGLGLWAALPLAIVIGDFAGYWLHRFGHRGWLWKVHGVHHTPDKVNTWNNNTVHFLNTLYSGLGKTLPLLLLGFSPEVIVLAAYVLTLQSFAVHANVDVELGWLGYVVMAPAHHRLHHSTKLEEAGNFASAITLWDLAFGTFVYGRAREPMQVGVTDPTSFPSSNSVIQNQLHPFVDQSRG
ncbi:MAG: sterol desaturase family protein [Proteobacteria bacterium]|nr:sterol desaturase family protein [Pseudomonadota bacterium]